MSDLNYTVGVDINQATASLRSLQSQLSGLGTVLGTLAFGAVTSQVIKMADSITSLRNRFSQLDPALGASQKQLEAVAAIAISTRTPLEQVGDLYFRIARSADALGISQTEAARITDLVAKALVNSGISAQEAAGPLLQLGQALQSGRFQGDELRSILEGLPPVSKALADALGVPVGNLRLLGSQGKITGDVFVKAMSMAARSIEEGFGRSIPTVSQQFEVLSTRLKLAVDEFMNAARGSQGLRDIINTLADVLNYLRDNIEEVARVFKALLFAFGFFIGMKVQIMIIEMVVAYKELTTAIKAATTATALLNAVTKANPLILGLSILAGGAAYLIDKFDLFGKSNEAAKNGMDDAADATKRYTEELAKFDKINALSQTPGKGLTNAERYPEAAQNLAKLQAQLLSTVEAYKLSNAEKIKSIQNDTAMLTLSEKDQELLKSRTDAYTAYAQKKLDLENKIKEINAESIKSDYEKGVLTEEVKNKIADLTTEYENHLVTLDKVVTKQVEETRVRQLSLFTLDQQIDKNKQLRKIQDDIAQLTMTTLEKKYNDIDIAARESADAAIEAEKRRRNVTQLDPAEVEAYYAAAIAGADKLKEATKNQYEESRKWSTGWKRAFNDYKEAATDAAKNAEAVFKKATQGMEDAIVNFAKTGKFEWKSFVSSIVEELLRQQVRELIAKTFGGMAAPASGGGGGGGGILGTIGSIFGFANGGIIPTNGPVLIGERGPELLMGAAGRSVVPNNQMGGTTVVYNINAVDAMSFKQMVARDPSFIYAVSQQGAKSIPSTRR